MSVHSFKCLFPVSFLLLAVVLVCGWFMKFGTLYQLTLNKCLLMMVMLLEHTGLLFGYD